MRSLTLEDFILKMRTLSEKEALIFLLQLCEALENISELSLVHGDVSPQNILLTDVLPLNSQKQQPIVPFTHRRSKSFLIKMI